MNKTISILIVEDEAFSAMFLRDALSCEGYQICDTVATGEGAIAIAENKRPDIILMDIRLAGELDGIEAASRIRQKNKIPIIFTTGHSDEKIAARARKVDPVAYLIKPIDIDELSLKINSVFSG